MSCLTDLVKTEYYTSKWVASNPLPVQYKLTSNLFPTNNVDGIDTIIGIGNNGGYIELSLGSSYEVYQEKEYIKIIDCSQPLYNGVWQIIGISTYGKLTVDCPYITSGIGDVQRYYNNYHILVQVYAGIPNGHALQAKRPIKLKDTIKVIPFTDNIAYVDVSNAIRSDFPKILNEYCKRLQNEADVNVNDWELWTSFYIAYAESYDIVIDGEVINFTSPYTFDVVSSDIPPVMSEKFVDPSFTSGITNYTQVDYSLIGISWVGFSGYVQATSASGVVGTDYIGQSVVTEAWKIYTITINYLLSTSAFLGLIINGVTKYYALKPSGAGVFTFEYLADSSLTLFTVGFVGLSTGESARLDSFSVTVPVGITGTPNYYYAVNGGQQFKYAQGNNMGEYVLNDNDLVAPTKFMTLFPVSSLFVNNEFDLSIIVPDDLLGTYDEINYEIEEYDSNGTLLFVDYVDFNYYDEGLYRIRLDNYLFDLDTAYFKFTIYLHNTNDNSFTRLSEEKKVVIEADVCKSETHLTWFNYLGAWEYFKFGAYKDFEYTNGENKIIRRNIYNVWDNEFVRGDTQDDIISKGDSFNSVLVRSQRLTLDQRDTIVNWLKRSIKVMKIESGDFDCITENNKRTIILNTDSFSTQESDKQYFIDFKYRETNQIITQFQ